MQISPSTFGSIECIGHPGPITGDALLTGASAWAKSLEQSGAERNGFVGLALQPSPEFFSALLGIWQSGACALVLDPGLRAPERQTICSFVKPVAVISANDDPWPAPTVTASGTSPDDKRPGLELAGSHPALALLTSGTTGRPKIVLLSFDALAARLAANINAIGPSALTRTLQTLSLSFGHGLIGSALTTLVAGGTLVLPQPGPALAMKLGAVIDQHNISFMTSVPAFWKIPLKASPPPSRNSLVRVHVGSAPLSRDHWATISQWTGCEVFNCYGMTETANWIAAAPFTEKVTSGLVGHSLEGQFAVMDADGNRAASGSGEVVVRSDGLMTGYFRQPDATQAVLKDGWYNTGDIGRLDADGSLTLVGRLKEEINRAGSKVQPAEVDQLLEGHPGVAEACTFAVPDVVSGEAVATAIVLASDHAVDQDELAKWCWERARKEIIPTHWYFVEELCRTDRGKPDRTGQRDRLLKAGD